MKLEICYMKCSKTIKTLFSLNICLTMIIFLLLLLLSRLRLFLMWKRWRRFCWSEFGDWRTKIRIVCYLGEKKKRFVKLVKSTWYNPTNSFWPLPPPYQLFYKIITFWQIPPPLSGWRHFIKHRQLFSKIPNIMNQVQSQVHS